MSKTMRRNGKQQADDGDVRCWSDEDGAGLDRRGRVRLKTIEDLDGRSRAYRNATALLAEFESDLGGPDNITGAKRELMRRGCVMGALLADFEYKLLREEKVDLGLYASLVDRQRRVLQALGLDRIPRQINGAELGAKIIDLVKEAS